MWSVQTAEETVNQLKSASKTFDQDCFTFSHCSALLEIRQLIHEN